MEEHLNPLAVTHLLQYTLRSLCCQDNSQWVYAVFWRILPRNYPPPKWDTHGGVYDRSRGNRRNWILVWEDGFCNFSASTTAEMNSGSGGGGSDYPSSSPSSSANYGDQQFQQFQAGLQPELFFKMSHEIYNYGEGLIGKVAADHSHKWIYKEPNENQEINFLSAWHNSADAQPRTWEAQFQSGIKTIALIAVREGVVQLGSLNKVVEDLSYIVLLRKKFTYIESIPGVLLPHPSSAAFPPSIRPVDGYGIPPEMWAYQGSGGGPMGMGPTAQLMEQYEYYNQAQAQQQQSPMVRMITPSMSSLEALLSKLPSVGPGPAHRDPTGHCGPEAHQFLGSPSTQKVEKEELGEEEHQQEIRNINNNYNNEREVVGECSSTSMSSYQQHFSYHHQDLNLAASRPSTGF
ncbi:protein RICE SALT SENSITIVE 3-like isoform X1 [Chenopodium quinoa]|uniref:protein RICE SALT SENSITIVE 3-like isoform X1 n=1 Tax=Chenopodium quinoa TaxID=63459 RepID=UPI000B792229|nr:protein RICE SALT SENSITIVE 3-like isoform X1 [Chenopodium quinoa]